MLYNGIKVNQNIRIYIVLVAMLNIFNSYIFAICVTEHTTSAILNSFLLKCHTNKNTKKFCESQLMVNIHISPSFSMNNLEKYLIVDEAYEPIKQAMVKLMSPYLIVINRGEPIIMYPLQYEKTISINDNVQCPVNVNLTKCTSEVSSSESIRSQSKFAFENKRKQRQTVPRGKFLRKARNEFDRRRSETINESKKNVDDDVRLTKELTENVLSKMGLIRILETPPNDPATTSTIIPELRDFGDVGQKTQVDEPEEVKNMEKGIQNPFESKEHLNRKDYRKGDIDSSEVADINLKFKTNSDYYNTDPLNDNAHTKPVDNFNEPSSYGKPVNDFNYPKVFGKPVTAKNKKLKTGREKEWMTKYYDPSNNPLGSSTDQKWLSRGMDSFLSADKDQLNVNDFRSGESRTAKYRVPLYESSKNNMYSTHNSLKFQPYFKNKQFDSFDINEGDEYNIKNPEEAEFLEENQPFGEYKYSNTKYSDDPYSRPYSSSFLKRQYSAMPSNRYHYQYINPPKRRKRNTLDYDISNLDGNPYMKENDESPCDTCGGKNKKTDGKPAFQLSSIENFQNSDAVPCGTCGGKNKKTEGKPSYDLSPLNHLKNNDNNLEIFQTKDSDGIPCDTCGGKNKKTDGKPGYVLGPLNPAKSNDNNFENFQSRENDAIPCDTCGGKTKKPGGKSLPHRSAIDMQEIHECNNVNPCNCCDDNVKNYNAKPGPHSCICLTNSEFCKCESTKATRALTQSCKKSSSYSIYNMSIPLPFLATNVRIFRKRHKTWWRITPSITLNSLSGIFANGNLSILLSSHVDILEMDKSLYLQNHKLVVPKQKPSVKNCNLNELGYTLDNAFLFDCSENDINEYVIKDTLQKRKKKSNMNKMTVKSIADLGYFPTSLNPLQKCPNNDQRLCLNVLDDKVPAFSIKIKMPFRENAVIVKNIYKAKISRIVTDATTKDALQILVDVINKGLEAKEFFIYLSNCPLSECSSSKSKVTIMLLPHIGETITFLLPFTKRSKRNSKFKCDVIVKANASSKSIVAKRSMEIQTQGRCFCIWRCQCHCIEKLETHINFNVCNRLGYSNEREAGLLLNCPPGNEKYDVCLMDENDNENEECDVYCRIIRFTIIFLVILLLLGLLKAILGLCFDSINRCGYETVQPGRIYDCDSSARKFFVNIFFFVIFPFLFWCKCFLPRKEDLMIASTEWYCNPECSSDSESNKRRSTSKLRMSAGSEQNYDIPDHLFKVIDTHHEPRLNKDDTDDDEETTDYILKVLEESKKSLTKMLIESQNESKSILPAIEKSSESTNDKYSSEAKEFLDGLTNAQIVYRMMDSPKGGLQQIPEGYRYCVQGFFLRSLGDTYEFVNYQPLTQYFVVLEEENNQLERLACPIHSYTNDFSRIYANGMDVFEAGDLSMLQPAGVPCLNISQGNLETSLCLLTIQVEEHQCQELVPVHDDQSDH
ncbi:uncharacterized protein LOC6651375 isoform X2 [Drosophila willistoni]|uniref:uncharacterized protein LOC6651375 isoform X2 n=1 Tax=Drosophila willistoni TaxID=7260 RepID=UPI001F081C0C|nr:uncharacterized protein LOC6651375 isoform X2 [Drosophila willistoni]